MRIVHVVEASATGTLSMVCLAANSSAKRGHSVDVIYSRRPETPANLSHMFDSRVNLCEVPMGARKWAHAITALRRELQRISPDVVHLHSSFAGFLGRIAALGTLRHSYFFYSPHCISVMRKDITWKKFIYAALERVAGLRSCTYIACSKSEQRAIKRWIGVDSVLMENAVTTGSDSSMGPPALQWMLDAVPFVITTVGGVRPQKNPSLFAQICAQLQKEEPRARFLWVGDGDEALVRELGEAGVEVLGWKRREDVEEILSRSHIYLSTSAWEGMPVSVIEAMAAGVPVVATSCPGNVDVIDDGYTGILFGTATEACLAIKKLLHNQINATSIAERAHLMTKDRFSIDRYERELDHLYCSVADH